MRKKRGSAVLLAVLVTGMLFLCACHGSKETKAFTVPQEFDTSKQYEVTFWAKNDTNVTQADIYKKAIEEFQSIYPNITVNMRLYTDYGRIYNDVITNIATGTTPNVCITYPDHIATYLTGENVMIPLDDLLTDKQFGLGGSQVAFESVTKEEIVPKFLEECDFRGHYYALPFMRSTEACYMNKDMIEALGYEVPEVLTWDFIWEVSDAATKKDADGNYLVNGQKVLIPFIYKSTDNMMIQYLKQTDAEYSSETGDVLLMNEDTRQFLYEIADHTAKEAFSTFKISSYPANFLNAGQCIFAVDSTAGATWMGSKAPLSDISEDKIVEFETEVRMIPQADPEHPKMISQGPSVCVFNKEDEGEVLASWLFAQYLLTNEVQIAYSQTEGYVPVTTRAQESAEYREYLAAAGQDGDLHYDIKMEAVQLLLDHVDDTFVTPVFNGSASLRDASGQLIEETVKAIRRKKPVDEEFMEKLFQDVTSLYHLDQGLGREAGKQKLGPMPMTSRILLLSLALIWLGIGAYVWKGSRKKKSSR